MPSPAGDPTATADGEDGSAAMTGETKGYRLHDDEDDAEDSRLGPRVDYNYDDDEEEDSEEEYSDRSTSEGGYDEDDITHDEEEWQVMNSIAADEDYFPRIVAIFYSIFHPTKGASVIYQVPEGSVDTAQQHQNDTTEPHPEDSEDDDQRQRRRQRTDDGAATEEGKATGKKYLPPHQHEALFDFKTLSEYIIPRAPLCGRLITYSTTSNRGHSYKIVSHPVILVDQQKYPRNSFIFNLAFVFDGRADVRAYEPIVRKCARELKDLEQNSSFLSKSQFRMYEVIEQLFEDLNSFYESFIALPDTPHSKYINEAAKTAELLREASGTQQGKQKIAAPKTWHDLMRGTSLVNVAAAGIREQPSVATRPRTPTGGHVDSLQSQPDVEQPSAILPLGGQSGSGHRSSNASLTPVSPTSVPFRPDAFRSTTDSTVTAATPLASPTRTTTLSPPSMQASQSEIGTTSAISPDVLGSASSERKNSNGSNNNSVTSTPVRPMANRAKTMAALAISGTTVIASNASGSTPSADLIKAVDLSKTNSSHSDSTIHAHRSASRKSSAHSQSESAGEKELNESIASLRSIAPPTSIAMTKIDSNGDSTSRRSSDRTAAIGAVVAPAAVLTPGKREPPHGLGRTVREAINVKLFPTYTNPKDVHDWDVPVTLLDLGRRMSDNWDLTMRRVLPFIDGINHVKRIAQLADADLELTRQCVEHLLYYRCIIIIDAFQFSNMYTVRPTIATLAEDELITNECASYVTRRGFMLPTWPKLLALYSSLRPSITLDDWIEEHEVDALGIDVRRFVTFGVIKGFLRRVHRYPVLLLGEAGAQMDRIAAATNAATVPYAEASSRRAGDSAILSPLLPKSGSAAQRDSSGSRERSANRLAAVRGMATGENAGAGVAPSASLLSPSDSFELRSPRSARRAERQETSDDYAWIGNVFAPQSREASAKASVSGNQINTAAGGSLRRRGLPHAPSGQLNQRKMRGATTVLDAANVAFELAARDRMLQQQQSQYPGTYAGANSTGITSSGTTTRRPSMRSPLTRALSPSAVRGKSAQYPAIGMRGAERDGAATGEDDARANVNGGRGPIKIPEGLIDMLDGTYPDDAFCVRFNRSWNDILRLLVFIGAARQHRSSPSTLATQGGGKVSALSLRRASLRVDPAAASNLDNQSVAGESGIQSGFGAAPGAADESAFIGQMSGFWQPPQVKTPVSSTANVASPAATPPVTTPNVSFPPPLPKYRQDTQNGATNNGSSGPAAATAASTGNQSGFSRFTGSSATVGATGADPYGQASAGWSGFSERRRQNSLNPAGASLADAQDDMQYDRQRIRNGDLGRIQLIIK